MNIAKQDHKRYRSGQRGVTLIETMIAAVVLLVGVSAVMGLFTVAISTDAAQGDMATRTAVYAQDKMEQLLALAYSDGASNTTVFPTTISGGTGLGGVMAANATVGGLNTASPVTDYVDYLNAIGGLQTISSGARYMRQWTISTNASGNLKTITVLTSPTIWTGRGLAPSTRLVCTKSDTQ